MGEAYSAALNRIQFEYTAAMAAIHLPNKTKLWINFVGVGVWVSGLGWVIVHFLLNTQDPLMLPNSSAEPLWLKVHGAFAFLALWTGGLMWGVHIVKAWNIRRHRWSGSLLFGLLLILIATGYLLYYVAGEDVRNLISWSHWVLGVGLPVAYLAHRLAKKTAIAFKAKL